ncbi:MAG: VOC family protein [Solirubrobacterales bacterium]|nr:VOC family protein [Solirubrobacterales bacterium]
MSFAAGGGHSTQSMAPALTNPVVHLELQTQNLPRACGFYTRLFGWRADRIEVPAGSYQALELGDRVEGGVVEHERDRALWLPYVEVAEIAEATQRARLLGASVCLEPREGPAGWRSVVATPAGAEIGLWQAKH